MSVRNRLALILAVVLLPLLLGAGLVAVVVVPGRLASEAHSRLRLAAGSVAALQMEACLGAGDSARVMALAVSQGISPQSALASGLDRRPGAGAILRGSTVVARSDKTPASVSLAPPGPAACSSITAERTAAHPAADAGAGAVPVPFMRDSIEIVANGGPVTAVVAVLLGADQLHDWAAQIGAEEEVALTVACPDGATASTANGSQGARLRALALAAQRVEPMPAVDVEVERASPGPGHPCMVVASTRRQAGVAGGVWTWLTLGLAALIGAALVWWLSRQLTLPILALTDAAERAAQGDLAVRLPVTRRDEVGRLAESFNNMAGQLDLRLSEIQHSRDLLSENVRRLGDALQRTHDLDGLLSTVCAISASTTGSQRATAWLIEGHSLVARVAWPTDSLRRGAGRVPRDGSLPGLVVADGTPRLLDGGDVSALLGGPSLAAALQRGSAMLGAVVVERVAGASLYSTEDAATLMSITGPAGIAMDNALLHREAQRMSITDPLTGVGNLRMLTTSLAAEVERARHFDRSVALLMVDLDHFRALNDLHGHAAGDAVLAAVAARIVTTVRSVDRVARYGGEEFAVVCPELDRRHARVMAEHLWSEIRREPFEIDGTLIEVRVSVGLASWPDLVQTSTDLLRAADAAVATAKRLGRDQVVTAADRSG